MTRYAESFERLKAKRQGAFVPFAVLGDPDPESSLAVLDAFVAGGADMLELGIPFSDPVADGPVIQAADLRGLAAGVGPAEALEVLAAFRQRHPDIPVGLLLYANLVNRPGLDCFYAQLSRAGVDSALIADLPLEEAGGFRRAASRAGVESVFMVTPMTSAARLDRVIACGGPYVYVVSRSGVTGSDTSLSATASPLLQRLRRRSDTPSLLGFGISRPQHVRLALAAGASGAISGSAAIAIIAEHAAGGRGALTRRRRKALASDLHRFVSAMKAATHQLAV